MHKFHCGAFFLLALLIGLPAAGQAPQAAQAPTAVRPDYILGPNDQILVRSNADEINERPYRVDSDGYITFPIVDRVLANGLTVQELEQELINRLREFLVDPQVTITVTGFRNEPVSFFGAFRNPGVYPLTGGRTLIEMLAVVGGFQPNAGRTLRVIRRLEYGSIPLPNAVDDLDAQTSSVDIDVTRLVQEINPAEDIVLQAYDRIVLAESSPVYVGGEVVRPAPLNLGNQQSMSLMQALTQAGGFAPTAKRGKVHVLRPITGTSRLARVTVDIERVLAGEENDFPLLANDIVFVDRQSAFISALPSVGASALITLPAFIITALIQ